MNAPAPNRGVGPSYKLNVLKRQSKAYLVRGDTLYHVNDNQGRNIGAGPSPFAAWRDAWLRLSTPKVAFGKNEGTVGITVRVPSSLHAKVCAAANKSGCGINGWVMGALETALIHGA